MRGVECCYFVELVSLEFWVSFTVVLFHPTRICGLGLLAGFLILLNIERTPLPIICPQSIFC